MKEKIAVYPGSFDPVTYGHIDVLERALNIFDKVIVALGDNPDKTSLFTVEERLEMLKESLKDFKNIEIATFSGLLLDFVRKKKATVIVRGLRAVSDFDYEFQRALLNRRIATDIETVFIMTRGKYCYLNSSIVKEMAQFKGDVSALVPEIVQKKLKEKFN